MIGITNKSEEINSKIKSFLRDNDISYETGTKLDLAIYSQLKKLNNKMDLDTPKLCRLYIDMVNDANIYKDFNNLVVKYADNHLKKYNVDSHLEFIDIDVKEYSVNFEDIKMSPEYDFDIHIKGLDWLKQKIENEDTKALMFESKEGNNIGAYIQLGNARLELLFDDCGGVKGSVGAGYIMLIKKENNEWTGLGYTDRPFYLDDIANVGRLQTVMFYVLMSELKANSLYWSKPNQI